MLDASFVCKNVQLYPSCPIEKFQGLPMVNMNQ